MQFSAATQTYKAGQFVLKASGDFQNLVSLAPADVIPTGIWAQAASIAFRGALKVVCVPKGSTWSVTLSDVPVDRPPRDSDKGNFGDYPSWRHSRRPTVPREAVDAPIAIR